MGYWSADVDPTTHPSRDRTRPVYEPGSAGGVAARPLSRASKAPRVKVDMDTSSAPCLDFSVPSPAPRTPDAHQTHTRARVSSNCVFRTRWPAVDPRSNGARWSRVVQLAMLRFVCGGGGGGGVGTTGARHLPLDDQGATKENNRNSQYCNMSLSALALMRAYPVRVP